MVHRRLSMNSIRDEDPAGGDLEREVSARGWVGGGMGRRILYSGAEARLRYRLTIANGR